MSVYQVVGAIAGAVVGFFTESPQAGFATYAAIAGVGAYLDQPDREGPRLEDLRQQLSVYGAPIPFEWGTNRHAGTVIWPQILEANEHSHSESAKGGPEQTTYTYTMSFAVMVCEGPIDGIRRIWANKKLVYDASTTNEGAIQDPMISGLRFYLGTEDQEVDPLIEATDGASPAYLGYAYVVFEDYDVTEMNGRLPQFEFEVVTVGVPGDEDAIPLGDCGNQMAIDPVSGYVWSVQGVPSTRIEVFVTDPITGSLIQQINYTPIVTSSSMGSDIIYNPNVGQFWIKNENGSQVVMIDPITYDVTEESGYTWPPPPSPGIPITWAGLIHYSPMHSAVVMANTNITDTLYSGGGGTPASMTGRILLSGSVFGVDQILNLSDGTDAVLTYQALSICIFNGSSSGLVGSYGNTDIGSSAFMAADLNRDRVLIINESVSTIIEFNQNTTTYTNHVISFPPELMPVTASTNFRRILWHEQNDKYYVTAHEAGLDWTLYTINPNTYEVEAARLYTGPTNVGNLLEYPNHPEFLIYTDSGTSTIYKLPLFNRIDPESVLLSDIVTDICERADLDASDINVSELTDEVKGYIVPRQMSGRAAIEVLQQGFYFDAVESDDKIKFVKRGSSTTTTIPKADRAAHMDGEEVPAHLEIRRAFDTELPIQCDVEYPDFDADHQIGNQYDRRITKDTRNRINLQLAIVMSAPKAKEIARCTLYQAWQKLTFRWVTTRKYAYLEPTDIVLLPTDEVTYRVRITNRRDQPNGLIDWEGAIEDAATYTQSGDDAITPPYQIQSVFEASRTFLVMMDAPLLRDEDDNAGYYVAMGGEA
jgi:hypothetical protein